MARMIHSMIRVRDEAASVRFYDTAFGLKVADRLVFDSFTLIYLSNAEQTFELELTVNHDRTTPYDLGDGYGHLAVSVADVDAEHARLAAAGLSPLAVKDCGWNPCRSFMNMPDSMEATMPYAVAGRIMPRAAWNRRKA